LDIFFFVFLILRRIGGGEEVKYANEMQTVFQIIIKFVGIFWGIFFFFLFYYYYYF